MNNKLTKMKKNKNKIKKLKPSQQKPLNLLEKLPQSLLPRKSSPRKSH